MFKPKSVLEVKGGNDRIYNFYCDNDSPLGEVHDALCSMRSFVLEQMKAVEEQENPSEEKSECKESCEEAKKEE